MPQHGRDIRGTSPFWPIERLASFFSFGILALMGCRQKEPQKELPMSDYVDAGVVGQHFQRKRETILGWAKRGLIPSHRLGKRIILFDLAEVADAIKRRGRNAEETNNG
jgi:hypothetical protein